MKFKYLFVMLLIVVLPACGGGTSPQASEATTEAAPPTTEAVSDEASTEAEPAAEEAPAAAAADADAEDIVTTDSGLQYVILEEGTGASPEPGSLVAVHYTGTLEDGTVFDSSRDRGQPIQFPVGRGQVIPGWDEGIALMKEGGKARLIIPSDLAYGDQGIQGIIPPGATLIFDVELVSVSPPPPPPPEAPTEVDEADYTTTDSGLKYYDLEEGSGDSPQTGQTAVVNYTGWLEDGTMFDSSLLRGQPFAFPVGLQQVIPGWDEGVASMKVGGKRQLVIPAELGYGERGAGDAIPPNATLIFEVDLLEIQ